jgi:sec-independent protein translocase protein TatC
MLLMAVPLMVLYEFGIIGARLFGKNQDQAGMDLPTDPDLPFKTAGTRMR